MIYGIPSCRDRATAYAAAITYWVLSCHDYERSPVRDRDRHFIKWDYLQTAIEKSSTTANSVNQYIANLCDRLVVPTLRPRRFIRMLAHADNEQVLYIGDRNADEMRQVTPDSLPSIFISPDDLLFDLGLQGVTERQILKLLKPVRFGGIPHVINMLCQGAHQVHGARPQEPEDEAIDVTPSVEPQQSGDVAQIELPIIVTQEPSPQIGQIELPAIAPNPTRSMTGGNS